MLQLSDETVMVDLTPEALQNRMKRGDVYDQKKVEQALKNFFRRGNLIALRELALRQVAEQVDRSLSSYMDEKDIRENWAVRERIAVCISANPTGAIPAGARGAHGAPDGRGAVRRPRRHRSQRQRTRRKSARRESAIRRKPGSHARASERQPASPKPPRNLCAKSTSRR